VSGGYTATYGWDAGSNLVAESVSDDVATNLAGDGWVISRSVNNVNQVTKVVTDGRLPVVHTLTESLTYDARGNRTGSVTTRTTGKKTHDLARVDYTFDGMDQLVGVLDHGANLNNAKDDSVTGWSRDGLGRGLSVSVNGATRDRVFDGTALIVDGDTRVTFGPDGRVLSEAFETVEGHGKNAHTITVSRDVLTDLLGSAVGVAEAGIVNADLAWFGDFGDTLSAPEWDTVTSFTGHVETAGLVEFATRTYDPASRVWVQEDSFTGTVTRASSLNRYAYVEGSPVSHTDVLGAYRAASAMAAQKLSAVDYAQFILRLKIFSAIGVDNEQVERARKLAAIDAQFEEDQRQIAEDGKFNLLDAADVGRHGFVNFFGGAVNGASGLVNGITGAVNWGNNTCASVHLCMDIPDIGAIPAIPIWGDYELYRWSSYIGSGTFQAVAVVGSGGIGAGGLGADATTALVNAFGINLARAGVSKISSLFSVGKTGTEAATAVAAESTATASLAADFTSGAQRAEAALANADRNAQVAADFSAGTGAAERFIATPSGQATLAQGSAKYPGVDSWVDGMLNAGETVWVGEPGISGFATTTQAATQVGNDATLLNQGLQVAARSGQYRPGLTQMVLTQDVPAAFSTALANPQFGPGGLAQVFVPNIEKVAVPWLTKLMK